MTAQGDKIASTMVQKAIRQWKPEERAEQDLGTRMTAEPFPLTFRGYALNVPESYAAEV
jgi:hypothetical protein